MVNSICIRHSNSSDSVLLIMIIIIVKDYMIICIHCQHNKIPSLKQQKKNPFGFFIGIWFSAIIAQVMPAAPALRTYAAVLSDMSFRGFPLD